MADGVALPQSHRVGKMHTLSRVLDDADDAPCHALVQKNNVVRCLNDLKRGGDIHGAGNPSWKAMRSRVIVAAFRPVAVIPFLLRPRLPGEFAIGRISNNAT